ncbi:hypothetical protein [Brevibacillus laterosporus]|uniref:hypothetical protein n=1 Tax=Brevibacillus laterosporus TaxID=1465 RepID=UPI000EB00602|nr:hypothetical protein [Brevibacillus laterosporus]AYK06572.1 hypothetical protein D8Z77_09415 [Brevibacillus laterosporus]
MRKQSKKMIVSLLSTSLLAVSLAVPVSASTTSSVQQAVVVSNSEVGAQQVGTYGWKTHITKEGVQIVIKHIRKGGATLERAISQLSPTAAQSFKRWSNKIADHLEGIIKGWEQKEEYAIVYLKDQLRNFLKANSNLSDGTIQEIVVAIEWLLWFVA